MGTAAFAGDERSTGFSDRIKALREKLEQFRGRAQEAAVKDMAAMDPAVLSDRLEHRQDAQVIVLYHDGTGAPPSPVPTAVTPAEKEAPAAMAPAAKSPLELAREKIRALGEARRASEERKGIKLADASRAAP